MKQGFYIRARVFSVRSMSKLQVSEELPGEGGYVTFRDGASGGPSRISFDHNHLWWCRERAFV